MYRYCNMVWILAFASVSLVSAQSDGGFMSMSSEASLTTTTTTEAEAEQSTLVTSTTTTPLTPQPIVTSSPLVSSQVPLIKRSPETHDVQVGRGAEFKFEPAVIPDVPIGDVISFEFYPGGHSVARADFEKPCVPYEQTGADRSGFWSGEQKLGSGVYGQSLILKNCTN